MTGMSTMRGRRIVGKQTVDPDLYPPPLLAGVTINQIAPNEALVTISTREATASEEAAPKVAEEPAAADALPTTTKTRRVEKNTRETRTRLRPQQASPVNASSDINQSIIDQ